MKYIVTQRIECVLIIPDGKPLEIDGFLFLREEGGNNTARLIQTEVEATTQEEARRKARKQTAQFLSKITILHNSGYSLLGIVSVSDGTRTTTSKDIAMRANVGIDGTVVKDDFEKRMKKKRLRIRPLQHYSDGINSDDPFNQFRSFYLVLEYYLHKSGDITNWIRTKEPTIEMKQDMYGKSITILTWIRHKISHSKKNEKGLTPLSISNPEHVELVQKHLQVVRNLAREIIRENEKI